MIANYSENYASKLQNVIEKLRDNNMTVIDISVDGELKCVSNTYITYQCNKCGAISTPSSIVYLTRRLCKCPKRCHNSRWNYLTCYDAAKKCEHIAGFRKQFGGAYMAAYENNWLKDYVWLNKSVRKPLKWNYQTTYEEAKNYDSRYSFLKGSAGAYYVAWENNWLDDYTWFKKSYQDVQHSDIINKINNQLKNFPELYFDETEFGVYSAGRNKQIILHCKKHPNEKIERNLRGFLYGRIPKISYCKRCVDDEKFKYTDFDEMIEELRKYKTLKEARENDICLIEHLIKTEEGRRYVDMLERTNSAWKRGIYSYKFNLLGEKYVYVGLTCNFEKRDRDHRHSRKSSVYNFSVEHSLKIPKMKRETEYIDWNLARHKEKEYMAIYQNEGYILINKIPGGGLGIVTFKKKYTLEEAINDVREKKYKNINDIYHRNSILYNQILHHMNDGEKGWGDLLPKKTRKAPNYWTRERVREIFVKFDTIAAMSKCGYRSAYMAYSQRYRCDAELNKIVSDKFGITFNPDCRKVGMFDDFGNLIREFGNKYEVDPELIGFSTLSRALSQNKKSRGYYWRYIEP